MTDLPFLTRPAPTEPCLCGSGARAVDCCADTSPDRSPPREIVVVEEFVAPRLCREIVAYAERTPGKQLTQDTPQRPMVAETKVVHDRQRVGKSIPIDGMAEEIVNLAGRAFRYEVEPRLGIEIEWFECPQLLRYEPGGRYTVHADSDAWSKEHGRWDRFVDRDVSLLIYLDADYTGGALHFPNFAFTLRPSTGMLVFFPSDHRYLHEATEVAAGIRHVLASWGARRGSERVRPSPPRSAFFMPERKDRA